MTERKDIPLAYRWRLEDIYESVEDWENALRAAEKLAADFGRFEGTLGDEEALLEALRHFASMQEIAAHGVRLRAHAPRMRDNRVAANQALTARAQALITKEETAASFLTPELLSLPAEYIASAGEKAGVCRVCRHAARGGAAAAAHALQGRGAHRGHGPGRWPAAPDTIYTLLADADMKFPVIKDEKGEDVRITHANYIPLMMNRDRRRARGGV